MVVAVYDSHSDTEHAAAGHPERPERLRAIRTALDERAADVIAWRDAPEASYNALTAVHTERHLETLEQLAAAGGGWIDADTYCTRASLTAARHAAGLAMAAADTAHAGQPALALTRPPGHHASADQAMGFCLINNVAVAAQHARHRGLERVAIVDIDVHHGNGTQAIFYGDADVLYTSLHQWPFYPGTGARGETGEGAGLGLSLNWPQPAGSDRARWWTDFSLGLLPAVEQFRPQLILVSAGYDAHAADPLAELRLDAATYARAAEELALLAGRLGNAATAWCLEGGYSLRALSDSVVATVVALAGASTV